MDKEKKNKNTTETRTLHAAEMRVVEATEDEQKRTIEGYAFLYNSVTTVDWYNEVILPGAADGLIMTSDVRALLNHDPNQLLARSKKGKGTLTLNLDTRGLHFTFQCPESRLDIIEMLERGDLDQCSFKFIIDEQRWIEKEGQNELREIVRFKELYDITLATFPAYDDTTVAVRCQQEARAKQQPENLDYLIEHEQLRCHLSLRQRGGVDNTFINNSNK